jgi:16S rRNA (cytosine967-C5)-methyltransferase
MRKIQAEVLESYSKIVKPGMVYATRYYLLKNQDQIAKFFATDIGKVQLRQRSKNSGFRIWF